MKKLFLGILLSFLIAMPAFGALHLHWVNGERVWYSGTENIFWIRDASSGLRIGDNIPFHYGDDDDSYIKYVSSTDTLQISGNTIELTGGTVNLNEIQLLDGKYLTFGTGDDMRARWTGSLFEWTPSTDDYVFSFGTAASTQLSVDLRWYGATSAVTAVFDAGLSDLILTGVELKTDQQITSTLADGTKPFVLTSSTKVDNLNADELDGYDWDDGQDVVFGSVQAKQISTLAKTADYAVTTDDFGKSIRVTSGGTITMTFPSVGAAEDGALLRYVKCGAGKLILDAADSDKVADSGAGGTIYNDVATQIFVPISFEYVHSIVTWVITGAMGTWVTTN